MENFTVLKTMTVRVGNKIEKYEQLYFGGQDIRYRKEGTEKVLSNDMFWNLSPVVLD